MVKHANIHEAKLAVMQEVEYVQKNGTMKQGGGGNYKYVTVDDVIARLRPKMIEHEIHFAPTKMELMAQEAYTTKGGSAMNRIVLGVAYRLTHASGSFEDGFAVGEGTDAGDKACNKAMTAAKKYALLQSFCLETGEDDPDHHASEEQERKPNGATKAASNGNGKTSDPNAVAREEFKAKIVGMRRKDLMNALDKFESHADAAAEKFGSADDAEVMKAATIARLYQIVDLDIGGLPVISEAEALGKWLNEAGAKYLSEMQVDTLNAKLNRRIENINEDLAKAQRQTR
jgi:hypothetical protein